MRTMSFYSNDSTYMMSVKHTPAQPFPQHYLCNSVSDECAIYIYIYIYCAV